MLDVRSCTSIDLETADFEKVEARLKALLDDRKALDTLPERCLLEQEFASAGLNELVADLTLAE